MFSAYNRDTRLASIDHVRLSLLITLNTIQYSTHFNLVLTYISLNKYRPVGINAIKFFLDRLNNK